MPKKIANIVILIVALSALGLGGYYAWWSLARRGNPINFSVVVPDKLYRSGQPRVDDVKWIAKDYGVKTIVCLSEDGDEDWDVRKAAQELGIKVLGVKMSRSLIPGPQPSGLILNLIAGRPVKYQDYEQMIREWPGPRRKPVAFPGPILLHCHEGKDRTGFIIALYRICLQGWSLEKAASEMKANYRFFYMHRIPNFLSALRDIEPVKYCPEN